jgi:chaperonin GroES
MIGERVLIKPDPRETVSPGGISLPEGSTDKPQTGTAVAVGIDCKQVRTGHRVLFSPYAESVTLDEVDYVLAKESDLYAILK